MPDITLVVNASPLIFLGNAGRLELLRTLGGRRILVPAPVFDEVIAGGYADTAARAISESAWLEKRPSPPIPESVLAWEVGKGESSVIATALQEAGAHVVIDDSNGRKCALAHGLTVVGTLGLVIAAHRQGRLPDPRSVLLELRAAGMWLSDAVIARALRIARVEPQITNADLFWAITQGSGRIRAQASSRPPAAHDRAGGAERRALTMRSTDRDSIA